MTSTTRDLLPVESVTGLNIRRSGQVCEELRTALRRYIDDYVAAKLDARLSTPLAGG